MRTDLRQDYPMDEKQSDELSALLARLEAQGCVLDYVMLSASTALRADDLHRRAALRGIEIIDSRLKAWAESRATAQCPIEKFLRLTWDERMLRGKQVAFTEFWGSDDVVPTLYENCWSIPNVDGYKIAFFQPPYGLQGFYIDQVELFSRVNEVVLGSNPEACEFYAWTTDWSNYFDAGGEWWGAYYWTIRRPDADFITVVGASATD